MLKNSKYDDSKINSLTWLTCKEICIPTDLSKTFQSQLSNMYSVIRDDSRFVPNQWETSSESNAVSHWLGTNLESALYSIMLQTVASLQQYRQCKVTQENICYKITSSDFNSVHLSNRVFHAKWVNTVWCCYNVFNFLTNIHKRHPIAHPLGCYVLCGSPVSDWYSAEVPVIIYVISSSHNCTELYHHDYVKSLINVHLGH